MPTTRQTRAGLLSACPVRRPAYAVLALLAACALEAPEPGGSSASRRADALPGSVPEPLRPHDFAWLPDQPVRLQVVLPAGAPQPEVGSGVDVALEPDPRPSSNAVRAFGSFDPLFRRGSVGASVGAGTWLWAARFALPDGGSPSEWGPVASFTVDPNQWTPGWLQTSDWQFLQGTAHKLTPWRVPGEVVFGFTEPLPLLPPWTTETLYGADAGWTVVVGTGSQVAPSGTSELLIEQLTADAPARLETKSAARFPPGGRVSVGVATNDPEARVWLVGPRVSSSTPGAPLIGVGASRGEVAWASSESGGRWIPLGVPWPSAWPADAGTFSVALAPYDAGILSIDYDSATGSFDLWVDQQLLARGLRYGGDAGVRVPAGLVLGHTAPDSPHSNGGVPGATRLWGLEVFGPAQAGEYLSPPLPLGARPQGAQRLGTLEWTEVETGGTVTLSLQHGTATDPWHDLWNLEAGGPDNSQEVRYPASGVDLSAINLDGPYQLRLKAYFTRAAWPGPSLKDWGFTWKGSRLEAVPPQHFRAAAGEQVVLTAQVLDWEGKPMGGVEVDFASLDKLGTLVTPNPHLTNPRGLAQARVQLATAPAQQAFSASAPVLVDPTVKYQVDTRAVPAGALLLNPDLEPVTHLACGQSWSYDARGRQGPSWTWSAPVAPQGFAVDPVSGLCTWTPGRDQTGPQAVVLRAEADGEFWDFPLPLEVNCTDAFSLRTQCGCGASGVLGGLGWLGGLLLLRRRRR